MYKLTPLNDFNKQELVQKLSNTMFIPLHPDNSDYQRFKIDLANGAELQDANSNVMTAEQVTAFLNTLP